MAIDEKKTAAASYILSFYNEVLGLTAMYANYVNSMIQLEYKYSTPEIMQKMTDEEKNNISSNAQNVRAGCIRTYILYKSIKNNLKDTTKNKELEASYLKCKNTYLIQRQDIETYVTELNTYLMSSVIQSILETSQNILNEIYEPATDTAKA